MTHLAQMTRPAHRHDHRVWVLPDSPLGRWSAALSVGAVLLVLVAASLVTLGLRGPGVFLLLGVALWSGVVAVVAALVAGFALVRDHALALAAVAFVGLAGAGAMALQLTN